MTDPATRRRWAETLGLTVGIFAGVLTLASAFALVSHAVGGGLSVALANALGVSFLCARQGTR